MIGSKVRKVMHVHWHISVTERRLMGGTEFVSLDKYEIRKDFNGMV